MNSHDDHDAPEPKRGDRLDALLGAWHEQNREAAESSRDAILGQLDKQLGRQIDREQRPSVIGRIGFGRMLSAAALLALASFLGFLLVRGSERQALADSGTVQVAEGGVLDALDKDGTTIGPCPLQHTDVKVEVSGLFVRTEVEQVYANPYPRTIEAVYTFPLSNRAAVDGMTMIVRGESGERVVEGEVKERTVARAMYETARESGYVASLLEQERPNIFTQSVANIEPGATVKVRIRTVELAQRRDGVAEFVFPMVVGPRYIPGEPTSMPVLPAGWEVRNGVVLRGPAGIEIAEGAPLSAPRLSELLQRAIPVRPQANEQVDQAMQSGDSFAFTAKYGNGSAERGFYAPASGIGAINGRFFFAALGAEQGTGFAGDTATVPDASRITPTPVKPAERAGHDISIAVNIDSGGPAITDVASELHAVSVQNNGASQRAITLDERRSIPNRDFILRWKVAADAIEPAVFAHVAESSDPSVKGGYFLLTLDPPARVAPAEIRPRELVFVLDTSGSMNGFPIEKSKALARKAIAAMRPNDTFNFITFAGATRILWQEPRVANDENRRIAEEFVNGAYSSGGTEMMSAVNAALVQDGRGGALPATLLDLPADGRSVRVAVPHDALVRSEAGWSLAAGDGRSIPVEMSIALPANPKRLAFIIDGNWATRDGNRVFIARSGKFEDADARTRLVFFLTDGYIGNDQGVIAAVRENARSTRVFTFGIGNSVNRFLLDEMARAGRGTSEVVTLSEEADEVIERLTRRIESPVLTDIELDVPDTLALHDLLPAGGHLPDLFDQEPMVVLGRFDRACSGTIVVRGRTGSGQWERRIDVKLPERGQGHDVVKTLWARAKVDDLLIGKLAAVEERRLDAATRRAVIGLGESYSIATPYTSFVAVEKSRVTVGGKPMLVAVPVELPDGTNWSSFFGEEFGVQRETISRGKPGSAGAMSALQGAIEPSAQLDRSRSAEEDLGDLSNMTVLAAVAAPSVGGAAAATPPPAPSMQPPAGGAAAQSGGSIPAVVHDPSVFASARMQVRLAETAEKAKRDARGTGAMPAAPATGTSVGPAGATSGGFSGGLGGGGGALAGRRTATEQLDSMTSLNLGVAMEAANGDPKGDAERQLPSIAERDRLVRILDRRLVLLSLAVSVGLADRVSELAAELGVKLENGTILVAIAVDPSSGPATIEALKAIGCIVSAEEPKRGLVVARVSATQLARIAEVAAVKRVEPIRG